MFVRSMKVKFKLHRSRKIPVEALSVKSGPTESGVPTTPPPSHPVGGELLPVDKLSVFLSQFWLLMFLIFLLPVAFLLYKKRSVALKFFSPLLSRFFEFQRFL